MNAPAIPKTLPSERVNNTVDRNWRYGPHCTRQGKSWIHHPECEFVVEATNATPESLAQFPEHFAH